ncbi:hypothetical protein Pfo_024246 [Paulownia fortunei]|nr:hypothetical protein Pfo_024246 [Paulownia fortunei]
MKLKIAHHFAFLQDKLDPDSVDQMFINTNESEGWHRHYNRLESVAAYAINLAGKFLVRIEEYQTRFDLNPCPNESTTLCHNTTKFIGAYALLLIPQSAPFIALHLNSYRVLNKN